MPRFKVWLAADTLLYMPAFALADLGILQRVAQSAGIQDAAVTVDPSPIRGDRACIEHMLRQADGDPGSIHIAFADPTRALQADSAGKRVSLLGALIKRPPLWEIGRDAGDDGPKHKYAYYNETLATGNFLGRRAAHLADDEDLEPCRYGEEFAFLEREQQFGQFRVITADIRKMFELMTADQTVVIHRRFAQDPELTNFVTTGVLTHRVYAQEHGKALALFMEALRSACIMLKTAEKPTAMLVEQIMLRESRGTSSLQTEPEVGSQATAALAADIAGELFRNEIYGESLSLTHAEWVGALKPRPMENAKRRSASAFYYKIYNPRPARDMTEDWLIRAIKDYGRFVQEARRLRGASIASVVSILLLAVNVLFADQAMRNVGAEHALIHYTSVAAIVISAGTLAAVLVALVRERPQLLLRFQSHIALEDTLAEPLLVSVATLLAFGVIYLPARFLLGATPPPDTIWSIVIGALGVIMLSSFRMWRRRDA